MGTDNDWSFMSSEKQPTLVGRCNLPVIPTWRNFLAMSSRKFLRKKKREEDPENGLKDKDRVLLFESHYRLQ